MDHAVDLAMAAWMDPKWSSPGALARLDGAVAAEEAHNRLYWKPYCDLQRTPAVRPDERNLGVAGYPSVDHSPQVDNGRTSGA